MIMIVSWAIENNLVYFDCFVIVSWAIEIELSLFLRIFLAGPIIVIVSWAFGK